jgi:hypothetical protein
MERLIIKTKFQNENEFYNYAKRNLQALINGHLPANRWKLASNKKNAYKRVNSFDCLIYYRCVSMSRKVKKIPFFVYWLNLKKQGYFTRPRIEALLNEDVINEEIWNIVEDLSREPELNQEIRERLKKTYNQTQEITYKNRISLRYQKRGINQHIIFNLLKESQSLLNKIRSETIEFIDREKRTNWRELRRNKRSLQKVKPEVLKWILLELEKEGRLIIKTYPPSKRVHLQSCKNH